MSAKRNNQPDVTVEEQSEPIPEAPAGEDQPQPYEAEADPKKQIPEKTTSAVPAANQDEQLKTVAAWASARNLATWQSAALARGQKWTDDKRVSESDFNRALDLALNRGQGGGVWAK